MEKVILYPNAGRDKDLALTLETKDMLENCGVKCVICPMPVSGEDAAIPGSVFVTDIADELAGADMLVTFGGDGTILQAARAAAGATLPILGVNMGGKGFMAELERDQLDDVVKAVTGECELENRMMLDIILERDGIEISSDFALNDVVIGGIAKIIDLTIYGDGHRLSHFAGDGAVIATPTGSTAYSMSAGGPIVEPTAENIIVTPICAHALEARSFVLAPQRQVSVLIGHAKANSAYMSVDGCDHTDIISGDIIRIRKSNRKTCLVHMPHMNFYGRVSEKLGG